MKLDDLSEGDDLPSKTIDEIRPADTKLLAAILEDPYPPHFDPERCAELEFPGLLNQGPANLSYVLQAVFDVLESPTDLRSVDVRYHDMVFTDQTVNTSVTVKDVRTDGDARVADFAVELLTADDEVVMSGTVEAVVSSSDSDGGT